MDQTTRSVKCDHCETELIVDTDYPHDWGLELASKDFGVNSSGMQFACICHPPLKRAYHFCGLKCLAAWAGDQVPAEVS